jgi:hypothetical protein
MIGNGSSLPLAVPFELLKAWRKICDLGYPLIYPTTVASVQLAVLTDERPLPSRKGRSPGIGRQSVQSPLGFDFAEPTPVWAAVSSEVANLRWCTPLVRVVRAELHGPNRERGKFFFNWESVDKFLPSVKAQHVLSRY